MEFFDFNNASFQEQADFPQSFTNASLQEQAGLTQLHNAPEVSIAELVGFPEIDHSDNNELPPEIQQTFGFYKDEPGAKLEKEQFMTWIPCFSRPEHPCAYCKSRHLDCWFTFEGQQDCSACKALFRPCSFVVEQHADVLMDTLATVTEDVPQPIGGMTGIKALRSYDRTPMDNPHGLEDNDDRRSRKSGARFSREAVLGMKRWIEAHRDNPYPTEEQKEELAEATNLSVGQVANWFANYRRRTKQRTRGVSPSIRSGPGSFSSTEAIPIPAHKRGLVFEGKTWTNLNPLDRWRASPPENEPAPISAIVDAVQNTHLESSKEPSLSRSSSRRHLGSGGNSDSFSHSQVRAPSISSLETSQSNSKLSSDSYSNVSLGSSHSYNSHGSGIRKDRRRRRKPSTNAALKLQNRPFQCTFCTDTFRTKYDWMRHEKSLHLSLEKWICAPLGGVIVCPTSGKKQCVFCDEADPTRDHLDTHNHEACGDKDISSRTFYRKDHLRQHLRLVHGCKMTDSMESWKAEATYIKSRCGFCNEYFSNWAERCDHLAKHFRIGTKMKEWRGCRGFDDEVSRLVINAMPPFLIGNESNSMIPFSASNGVSMGFVTAGTKQGEMEGVTRSMSDCLLEVGHPAVSDPTSECLWRIMPGVDQAEMQTHLSGIEGYDLSSLIGAGSQQINPAMPTPRVSTCWEILTVRLGRYARDKMKQGVLLTDEMLQNAARWILYESDDPWNQTAADNREWLELFKKAHGLPSIATDETIDWMEDLGAYHDVADINTLSAEIGDLSFESMIQDSSWDSMTSHNHYGNLQAFT